ncbi:MAG TPA: helix-turn-helix domain-containing protein [Xanthobacteraceae bacterium]|nr:helix-turn-helix domain-containing protein [Xanthobacteraceae bacterium]
MNFLETGLRGGAIALLALLAITGWRDAWRAPAVRLTVLFDLCAIAFLVESAPAVAFAAPPWIVPVRIISMATPAVFLHWAAASFDDFYVPRWWRWLPFAAMAAIAAWAILSDWAIAWRLARIAAFALIVAGIWRILAGRAADLIERRRRLRLILAIGVGLWIAALTALSTAASEAVRASAGVVTAGGVLVLALAAALLRLRVEQGGAMREAALPAAVEAPAVAPVDAVDAEERAWLDRLSALMERERIYRAEDFSLARLAQHMKIPEYRLRRLINQRLGQRNFISYVNGYRLAETMAALADPSQRQVPILTIALDAGFQSIGPFNRAFKAHTGQTPSEFRRERLTRVPAALKALGS